LSRGLDLSPEDLVNEVRTDYMNDLTSLLGEATEDQILELLGEANAEKLRKADLKRLKNPQGNPFPQRSPARKAADGTGASGSQADGRERVEARPRERFP